MLNKAKLNFENDVKRFKTELRTILPQAKTITIVFEIWLERWFY